MREEFPVRGEFAEQLDYLARNLIPRGRGSYSTEEIAMGAGLPPGDVAAIAAGDREPTEGEMGALASFFGLPVRVFTDAERAEEVAAELLLLFALRDAGVQEMRVCGVSGGLDVEGKRGPARMIEGIGRESR